MHIDYFPDNHASERTPARNLRAEQKPRSTAGVVTAPTPDVPKNFLLQKAHKYMYTSRRARAHTHTHTQIVQTFTEECGDAPKYNRVFTIGTANAEENKTTK